MSTQKRGKTYHSRVRVPSDLRLALKKTELIKSLKTNSYREAFVRSCIWEAGVARLFSVLRTKAEQMDEREISRLVQQYINKTLEKCEEERLHNLERVDDDELEAVSLSIIGRLEENAEQLMSNDFTEVTKVAKNLLAKNNLTVLSDSTPYHEGLPKQCGSFLLRNTSCGFYGGCL